MDINATFILSDYNLQNLWSPWNDSDQVTRNLKYHILSPEEKKSAESSMQRTACWIHTSLTRNLFLYSMNPSLNKTGKKIIARCLSIPSFFFDTAAYVLYMPVVIVNAWVWFPVFVYKLVQVRSLRELQIVYFKHVLAESKNKADQGFFSCFSGAQLFLEFLFGFSVALNLALPGYKIFNKNQKKEEFVLDLSKLDYLRKYCGWEDASEEEVLQLVKTQLETSEPFVEYEIDESNHLKWEFSVLQKPLERGSFQHLMINSMNELKKLKTCEI
jgi:hypothetical protein